MGQNSEIKFVFLILNYNNVAVTNSCINNLLKTQNPSEIKIVVVDNGSTNNSASILTTYWGENPIIDILLNKENMGFSRGNNLGYKYIKNNYIFDFLIVMNSDIEIRDNLFCRKIETIYRENYFDILGPDIYKEIYNIHQNPERIEVFSTESANIAINNEKKHLKMYIYYSIKMILKSYIMILKRKLNVNKNETNYCEIKDSYNSNMKLHGACFIFSQKYIKENDNVFYPETFLYCEEDILAIKCYREKYKMLYSPEIQVIHLGSASSNLLSIKGRKDYFNRRIKALEIVREYIIKEN